ncbi:MAG: SIMPL domain-containing protein [Asticcacaulis sp.]
MRAVFLIPLVLWAGGAEAAVRSKPKAGPATVAATPVVPDIKLAPPSKTEAAPWWMDRPVLPQTGEVTEEVEANRARFSVSFEATAKTVDKAQADAIGRSQALTDALRKLDPAAVNVSTAFEMRALYKQYRLKDGSKVEDERGDRIEGYQVTVSLSAEIRDMGVLERAYALALAASPTSSTPVEFDLVADNDTKTRLFTAAIANARSRAEASAAAMGMSLGALRVIDSTGRVCSADILGRNETTKEEEGSYAPSMDAAPPPPSMRSREMSSEMLEVKATQNAFIQTPPLFTQSAQACLIYELK